MISGAHSIIYSKRPEADRAFLRDVLGLPHVDVGGGWLIFGLPPAEVAVHPSSKNDLHEFYLMADDVEALIARLRKKHIASTPVRDLGWGLLTQVSLPGGGKLGIYQPRHARPESMGAGAAAEPAAARPNAAREPAARKGARRTLEKAPKKAVKKTVKKSAKKSARKPARKGR